jgi:hypothetical protein
VLAVLAFAGPQTVVFEHSITPRCGNWREPSKANSAAQLHVHGFHKPSTKNRTRIDERAVVRIMVVQMMRTIRERGE